MKKTIIICAVALIGFAAFAQGRQGMGRHRGEEHGGRLQGLPQCDNSLGEGRAHDSEIRRRSAAGCGAEAVLEAHCAAATLLETLMCFAGVL